MASRQKLPDWTDKRLLLPAAVCELSAMETGKSQFG
jgi:hypothetical protein